MDDCQLHVLLARSSDSACCSAGDALCDLRRRRWCQGLTRCKDGAGHPRQPVTVAFGYNLMCGGVGVEEGNKLCGGSWDEMVKHWVHNLHLQLHAMKNWVSSLGVQRGPALN